MPRIPEEIMAFFNATPGQTMLIKGSPGTGKTILSLEILDEVCEKGNGLYLSTRVTPQRLFELYPWASDVIPERNVVNATQTRILKSLKGTRLMNGSSEFDYASALNFFKTLYEDTEEIENPMIVVDSWDAILSYLNIGDRRGALEQSLCEFCHDVETSLIFVAEREDQTSLDYAVDGVVNLLLKDVYGEAEGGRVYDRQLERRTCREVEINKLRGVRIRQHSYIFTLDGGRFRYFPAFRSTEAKLSRGVADPDEDHISSGMEDLDRIVGGFERHGFYLFEVEHGVGHRHRTVTGQIRMNAAANGKGVLVVPEVGERPPSETDGGPMRFFMPTESIEESAQEVMAMVSDLFQRYGEIVGVIALDFIENRQGAEETMEQVNNFVPLSKRFNETTFAVVKKGMKIAPQIAHTPQAHFVFKDLSGALTIYGVQPRTGLYAVTQDEEGVHLTPIV